MQFGAQNGQNSAPSGTPRRASPLVLPAAGLRRRVIVSQEKHIERAEAEYRLLRHPNRRY